MRLDYGTDLRNSVFGPLDESTVDSLRTTIAAAIEKYAPRVVVRSFDVVPDEDKSQIDISLVFSMKENVFTTEGISLTVNSKGIQINA